MGIHKDLADDSILDKYADERKRIWAEVIDPMSRENFRRLHDQDPDKAHENDEFFRTLILSEKDEALARELALVSYRFQEVMPFDRGNTDFWQGLDVLKHDMAQYYVKRPLRPSSL